MGVEQGSYCTWDKQILLEQVPFQNSGTTCLNEEFDMDSKKESNMTKIKWLEK